MKQNFCKYCNTPIGPKSTICKSKECIRKSRQCQTEAYNKKVDGEDVHLYKVVTKKPIRGHGGLYLCPHAMEEDRKSALDWLLKGRIPEPMNPVKIKVKPIQVTSFRDSMPAIRGFSVSNSYARDIGVDND